MIQQHAKYMTTATCIDSDSWNLCYKSATTLFYHFT